MIRFETETEICLEVTNKARDKMDLMVELTPTEIGWLGLIEKIPNTSTYRLIDVYVLEQGVHSTTTEIAPEAIAPQMMALLESGEMSYDTQHVKGLYFWGHSHVNMGVTPSGQDESQLKTLLEGDVPYYFRWIQNKKGERSVKFAIKVGDGLGTLYTTDVKVVGDSASLEALRAEVQAEIDAKVKPISYTHSKCPYTGYYGKGKPKHNDSLWYRDDYYANIHSRGLGGFNEFGGLWGDDDVDASKEQPSYGSDTSFSASQTSVGDTLAKGSTSSDEGDFLDGEYIGLGGNNYAFIPTGQSLTNSIELTGEEIVDMLNNLCIDNVVDINHLLSAYKYSLNRNLVDMFDFVMSLEELSRSSNISSETEIISLVSDECLVLGVGIDELMLFIDLVSASTLDIGSIVDMVEDIGAASLPMLAIFSEKEWEECVNFIDVLRLHKGSFTDALRLTEDSSNLFTNEGLIANPIDNSGERLKGRARITEVTSKDVDKRVPDGWDSALAVTGVVSKPTVITGAKKKLRRPTVSATEESLGNFNKESLGNFNKESLGNFNKEPFNTSELMADEYTENATVSEVSADTGASVVNTVELPQSKTNNSNITIITTAEAVQSPAVN